MTALQWHADASHAMHPDGKGRAGGTLTLGEGAACNQSAKQKSNARSSTESELAGADDSMPQILWTNCFLKAQGCASTATMSNQDNQSAVLLEKNGKMSSSKRTKHINNRHFFVTDCQSKGESKAICCPTDEMMADCHTKPLQGAKFYKFGKMIMGLEE